MVFSDDAFQMLTAMLQNPNADHSKAKALIFPELAGLLERLAEAGLLSASFLDSDDSFGIEGVCGNDGKLHILGFLVPPNVEDYQANAKQ